MPTIRSHVLGMTLIALSTLAWSVTGFFTRLVALDSVTLIVWRGIFGTACLLGVAVLLRGRMWTDELKVFGKIELLYIAISTVGTVMLFFAFAHTSVAHVAVIFASLPMIAALCGWLLLRESTNAGSLAASVVALCGVAIMVSIGSDGGILGDFLALGMTLTTTLMIMVNRRYPTMPVIGCSAASLALTSALLFPFAQFAAVSDLQLIELAAFAFINSVFGVAVYALGSRHIPAVEVGLIGALDAPLAALWVWIAFNERPGWNTVAGGSIVVAAVIIHVVTASRGRNANPS